MENKNLNFYCAICGTTLSTCDTLCQNCLDDLENESKIEEYLNSLGDDYDF